jgi:hypothetical protein
MGSVKLTRRSLERGPLVSESLRFLAAVTEWLGQELHLHSELHEQSEAKRQSNESEHIHRANRSCGILSQRAAQD